MEILISSELSEGIHTFIIDQRFAPVNIARKIKKNHIYHKNQSIRYAKSPRIARRSISVVTLMLKAKPIRMPMIIRIG